MAIAHDVIAERMRHAARERLARSASRRDRRAHPLRLVGRLLVRLGTRLGGAPEIHAPARTLTTVRPR